MKADMIQRYRDAALQVRTRRDLPVHVVLTSRLLDFCVAEIASAALHAGRNLFFFWVVKGGLR